MTVSKLAARAGITILVSFLLAACGGEDDSSSRDADGGSKGGAVSVYSSLPLAGDSDSDIVSAIKLALKQKNYKCGDWTVNYRSLDSSNRNTGRADRTAEEDLSAPDRTQANARTAVRDDTAVAYLGDFTSSASAISIPITNEAGLLQVSPKSTATGLTKNAAGTADGEPDNYYPTGDRTFARLLPTDSTQGIAIATYMKAEGVTNAYLLDDTTIYAVGIASATKAKAAELGIEIAGEDSWRSEDSKSRVRSKLARVKSSDADGVLIAGSPAPRLIGDLARALPDAELFVPDRSASTAFVRKLPEDTQRQTYLTAPFVAPSELPPAGQKFYQDFMAEYGESEANVDPYAIYAFESMTAVCDSIAVGGDDRKKVIEAFFSIKDRESPLGTYSLDADGDTTLSGLGGYRVVDDKLIFDRVIDVKKP